MSRPTGSFLVIEPSGGATLAAGLVGGHLPVLEAQPVFEIESCTSGGGPAVITGHDSTSPGP